MLLPRALILLVACAAAGCTATTESASPRSTPPPAALASTDAASERSLAPSPPPDAGYSFCGDRDGDGNGVELSGVQVDRDGTTLKILWVLGEEVPTQGRVRYTLDAANEDGTAAQQFVVGYQDGSQVEYYARDVATGQRTDMKGEADFDDSFLISAFPAGALNQKFNYSVAGLLGESVGDRCPDDAGTVLYDQLAVARAPWLMPAGATRGGLGNGTFRWALPPPLRLVLLLAVVPQGHGLPL